MPIAATVPESADYVVVGAGSAGCAVAARLSEEFAAMVNEWVPLTLMANSLSRSLGHEDVYPFALSYQALRKMQFVHELVKAAGRPGNLPRSGAASC